MNTLQYQGADGEAILKDISLHHFMNIVSREDITILA